VQPRVATTKPRRASAESPGWACCAAKDRQILQADATTVCEQSTQLIPLRGSRRPQFRSVCWTR